MNYYFDVDGVLADFHSAYDHENRAESLTYKFIRGLRPFKQNIALVKTLIACGHDVYVSTMVANEHTKQARIDWLNEFLPEIPTERIIAIVGRSAKKHECMLTANGILIDDKKTNCNQWEKAGHKAIWLEEKGGEIHL